MATSPEILDLEIDLRRARREYYEALEIANNISLRDEPAIDAVTSDLNISRAAYIDAVNALNAAVDKLDS